MKTISLYALLVFSALAHHQASAQEVGNFKLLNVVNNQTVSLDAYSSSKGVVLIFTSNSCPYDEYYRKRIATLAQAFPGSVPVLLVNAHTEPGESVEKMQEKAQQLQLGFPYLADKDQSLMTTLNVRKSPEAFLLKNSNGKFIVVYRGAIDDNAQVEADVRHHYLRDAINTMLANQTIGTPEVRPVGCNVRKKP